jgi:hypothetical protein
MSGAVSETNGCCSFSGRHEDDARCRFAARAANVPVAWVQFHHTYTNAPPRVIRNFFTTGLFLQRQNTAGRRDERMAGGGRDAAAIRDGDENRTLPDASSSPTPRSPSDTTSFTNIRLVSAESSSARTSVSGHMASLWSIRTAWVIESWCTRSPGSHHVAVLEQQLAAGATYSVSYKRR